MPRYAYVNGQYVPHKDAAVHIEDRGYQFADGVYEVIACINGKLADEQAHYDRLARSLSEIGMDMPVPEKTLGHLMRELLRKNRLSNANVYIQVTRGAAKRDFKFPAAGTPQSLVLTARPFRFEAGQNLIKGAKVITVPDIRWKRRDIKSVALLPQVLAKQKAAEKGAYEAWMVDDAGFVTEGSSSNAWIVTRDKKIVTRVANHNILRGVTRSALEKLCAELQFKLEERSFTKEEAFRAQEAFTSSAVALICPVVEIDGHKIGTGKPGPVTLRLYDEYRAYVEGKRGAPVRWKA